MNAIKFLIIEHNRIRKSFAAISKKTRRYASQKTMFKNLSQFLLRHETMEQKVWYPFLRKNKKVSSEIKHLISEEKGAKKIVKQLQKLKAETPWEMKLMKLKKEVEHHADEEETNLFPIVAKIVDKATLNQLGKDMQKFKKRFKNKKF